MLAPSFSYVLLRIDAGISGIVGVDSDAHRSGERRLNTRSGELSAPVPDLTVPLFGAPGRSEPRNRAANGMETSRSADRRSYRREPFRGLKWVVFEPNDEPALGADPAQCRRVHERPFPPGRVSGSLAERRIHRQM